MATPGPPSDAAMKARILSHMNSDHSTELSHYLRVYANLPSFLATPAELTDITLTTMTIVARPAGRSETTHVLPLVPEAKSFAQMRGILVGMAHAAAEELGIEKLVITEWVAPATPMGWLTGLGVSVYFLEWLLLPYIAADPHGPLYFAWGWFPSSFANFSFLIRTIFWPVLICHIVEAAWFEKSRLQRFHVSRGSPLWFLWVFSIFLMGFPGFQTFDALVASKKLKAQDGKSH